MKKQALENQMMKPHWIVGLTVAVCTLLSVACRHADNSSQAKFDANIANVLNNMALEGKHLDKICSTSSLLVFIGNAEQAGYEAKFPNRSHIASDHQVAHNNSHAKFDEAVERARADILRQVVDKNTYAPCINRANATTDLVLITDRNGSGDSRITFVSRDNDFVEQNFIYRNGKVTEGSGAFELNMAKDVSDLIQIFRDRSYELKNKDKGKLAPYQQISYYIKTHGGTYRSDDGKIHHALLFDTNGPDGRLKSDMWHAVHSMNYIKAVCGEDGYRDSNPHRQWCASMATEYAPVQGFGGEGSGGFTGNGSGGFGGEGSGGFTGNGSGGFKGNGSGGFAGNGSGGFEGNGSGGFTGHGSGGFEGNGSGGFTGHGSGSLKSSTSTVLGNYTLSRGEIPSDESFASEPNSASPADNPDGYREIGAAAIFGELDLNPSKSTSSQRYSLKFRVAKNDGPKEPVFVIFDSCNMSNKLDNNVFANIFNGKPAQNQSYALAGSSSQKQTVSVITLSNSKPLYVWSMDYKKVSGFQYKALPYVFYWGATNRQPNLSSPSIRNAASEVTRLLGMEGLNNRQCVIDNIANNEDGSFRFNECYNRIDVGVKDVSVQRD